jgi:putative phosphoesterase
MPRLTLISDTHGLLRPEVIDFVRGSARIVHAGDVGDPAILDALSALAPLTVVRGNNDRGPWAEALADTDTIAVEGVLLHVLHDLATLDLDPAAAGIGVVVSGHSHKPRIERRDGVLYVNPGSVGPRRFSLPIAAAELLIEGGEVRAHIVEFPR